MISSVYDYYLSTYGNKEVSKYDSHKNSELKEVYSSMLKVNRHSPLYKFENLTSVQKYQRDGEIFPECCGIAYKCGRKYCSIHKETGTVFG